MNKSKSEENLEWAIPPRQLTNPPTTVSRHDKVHSNPAPRRLVHVVTASLSVKEFSDCNDNDYEQPTGGSAQMSFTCAPGGKGGLPPGAFNVLTTDLKETPSLSEALWKPPLVIR